MKLPVTILLLTSLTAYGQREKELFHVRTNMSPMSIDGDKDALYGLDLAIKFPLMIHEKTQLGGGVGYEALWTDHYPLFGGTSVQGVSTQFVFNRKIREDRSFMIAATAGIYSDFKDISGEDFRYTLAGRYKTTLHEKFTMSYGLAISRQFFGIMMAPFIDFDWKKTDRLRLSGPFPLNTRLRYQLTPKTEISFFLKPDNSTYRLSKETYESRYFQKKQWNAGLGFDYFLTSHWLFSLKSGYSLKRRLEIYDDSQTGFLSILTFDLRRNNKRTPYYRYEGNAFFAEATLAWVITKD